MGIMWINQLKNVCEHVGLIELNIHTTIKILTDFYCSFDYNYPSPLFPDSPFL